MQSLRGRRDHSATAIAFVDSKQLLKILYLRRHQLILELHSLRSQNINMSSARKSGTQITSKTLGMEKYMCTCNCMITVVVASIVERVPVDIPVGGFRL